MTGSINLTTVKPSDVAVSADGTRLYAAGEDGRIRVYDLATRTLLQTWPVGTKLGGIDLSPDGSFLLVTERQFNGAWGPDNVFRSSSTVYKVDLATGAVTTFSIQQSGDNYAFYDVAILASGEVLLTQDAYSANLPLWTLNLGTGQFAASAQLVGVRGVLEASADRSHALVTKGDISDAPIYIYEGGAGITHTHASYQDGVQGYNVGVLAISEAAGLVVQNASGNLYVYDTTLDYQFNLAALHPGYHLGVNLGGVAFDSTGANLYILSDGVDGIIQIATSDWHIVRTFDVGADVGDPQIGGYGNRLSLSPDGKTFIVSTATGIQLIANDPSTSGQPGPGQTTGTPGADNLQGGSGGDTLAGDSGGDTIAGLAGNDLLYSYKPLPQESFYGYPYQRGSGDIYADVDTLSGGDGSDYLFAGYGDNVAGGANDGDGDKLWINFQGATSGVVADFRPLGTGATVTIGGGTISGIEEVVTIDGSEFDDFLAAWSPSFGYATPAYIYGRGGNDHIIASYWSGWGDSAVYGGEGNDLIDIRGAGYSPEAYGEAGDDRILSGSNGDNLYGGDGADTLEGNGGLDWLYGGIGGDVLDGGGSEDRLRVEDGDDRVYGAGDSDWLYGGSGNDELHGDFSPLGSANHLSPSANDDRLFGEEGDDLLSGDQGADTLDGGTGNDRLSGGAGVDSYAGGDGIDTADFSGEPGPVAVNIHSSLFTYPTGHPNASRSLGPGEALDSFGNYETLTGIENLILTAGDDSALGSDGANRIEAGAGNDVVSGRGGDDALLAGSGDDEVGGGDGNDSIEGGDGLDTLFGDSGNDSIDGGSGDDLLAGGLGDDSLAGAGGDDVLLGEDGNDNLAGGDGYDLFRGGGGVDSFDGGANLAGSDPSDIYRDRISFFETRATQGVVADLRTGIISNDGFGNVETMTGIESLGGGTAFADIFYGNDDRNGFMAALGDSLYGFGGDDFVELRAAAAVVDGGDGTDTLRLLADGGFLLPDANADGSAELAAAMAGGWEADLVAGTLRDGYGNSGTVAGIENLIGSGLGDRLRGSAAANRIEGGAGNDVLLLQDGGDDVALGGEGNDVLYFGSALSAGDIADGGEGRDAIVLQGNVTAVLNDTNLVDIESISIQSGANATFGDTANNFYDYDVTTADGNVAAGQQLIVNAQSLRAGEDFTFDGSAESDGRFLIYGGHGTDDLIGGDGVDVFFFEGQRWTPGDRVDGGDGRDSLVISGGSGLTHIEFAADSFTNIESISVNNRYATDPSQKPSYELVLNNGNVAPGATLIVNGSSIPLGQSVNFDGAAVQDGNLILFGGGGHDVLTGGAGADLLIGGGGADALTGGAGADTFRYDSVSDSIPGLGDLIGDFATGTDRIDLSRIDADTATAGDQAFSWIGANAFSGTAGELRVFDDNGYQRIEGDTNGDGLADLVITLQLGTAPIVQADFLF